MLNINKEVPLRLPNQLLNATRFEIWSKGQKIDSGTINADLWVEHLYPNERTEGLQITVRIKDQNKDRIYKYIQERFFLDVAYAIDDRILVAIIPEESNIVDNNSFNAFVEFAPFYTRKSCVFNDKTPYCCSLFLDENLELMKVTYSNAMNNTLIEFYH
jgi:hypothetical protein